MKKCTLPDLPYDYAALEPAIIGEIMELHHAKHHATYVKKFNEALEKYEEAAQKGCMHGMTSQLSALNFNGGGHINHSHFWESLAPTNQGGGTPPTGALKEALDATFGSVEKFIEEFNAKIAPLQGSGWGWLLYHKQKKYLWIEQKANQDPVNYPGVTLLLGIDVWEHAYYLQYKNARPEYLKNIWNVVNWKKIEERFQQAK